MVWVKLDDTFTEHPKVVGLSDKAFRAYVRSLCYSAKVLSDGMVPGALARSWASLKHTQELVTAGLWETVPMGYAIHDYHVYQETKAQVLARRQADSARKRSGFSVESLVKGEGLGTKTEVSSLTRRTLEAES